MNGKLTRLRQHHAYRRTLGRLISRQFHEDLVAKTENFSDARWLGEPVWQNVLDLWTVQEALAEVKPALLIESGTFRGGSALFYAHLFDLLGNGRVVTIDIERLHSLDHPRVTALTGSSLSAEVLDTVHQAVGAAEGPVMVILDSDHSEPHVRAELTAYAPLVTSGSLLLVQDGCIDQLAVFRHGRPGPLPAVRWFLTQHPEFEVDVERNERFLITHHPCGWLRRA